MSRGFSSLMCAATLAVVCVSVQAADTIVGPSAGFTLASGSYATNTPNIGATWSALSTYWDNSDNWYPGSGAAVYSNGGNKTMSVLLSTNNANFKPQLKSVDLVGRQTGTTTVNLYVDNAGSATWTQNYEFSGTFSQTLNIAALNLNPLSSIKLEVVEGTGDPDAAIRNLTFAQAQVPEPASLSLLGLGSLALLRRRR